MDNNITDGLDKLARRMDSLEKEMQDLKRNQDLLYSDRNILETIQANQTAFREELKLAKQHYEEILKTIKEEIGVGNDRTVIKVETAVQEGVEAFKRGGKKTKSLVDRILRR
jgi:hypothetical protein